MNDEIEINYEPFLEAAKIDAEKNKQENLTRLKYDASRKTIEIKGIDGRPYRCRVAIDSSDLISGNGMSGINHMRRTIYANQMADGTPYIRIPPHMLKTYTPDKLLPIVEHEAEHIRQMLNKKKFGKQSDPNEVTYLESRDKKAVIEYTKEYIKKHPIALNKHDRLDYELLADFHAALKYGRKSYSKALRNLSYQKGSYAKLKKQIEAVFDDSSPLLKLYESGERNPGPYVKKATSYLNKLKATLKNVQQAEKYNKNNNQEIEIQFMGMMKAHEQIDTVLSTLKVSVDTWTRCLEKLKAYERRHQQIPESEFNDLKVMKYTKKISSSFPFVIGSFAALVISTEYRLKFLKEIMRDKPWLKDADKKYRTVYEAYVPLEFDDWIIDESVFQEEYDDCENIEIDW